MKLIDNAIKHIDNFKKSVALEHSKNHSESYKNFEVNCDLLCASYIYCYIGKCFDNNANRKKSIIQLESELKILPSFTKFFNFMLFVLKKFNWIDVKDNVVELKETNCEVPDPAQLYVQLYKDFPEFKGSLEFLNHCVSNYPQALSGEIPAIGIIYPNGDINFYDDMLKKNSFEYSNIPIMTELVSSLIISLSNAQIKEMNILEIGGGRGILTRQILPNLKNEFAAYHFTDIGRKFVIAMQKYGESESYKSLTSSQFDITKNPVDQGLMLAGQDIILGFDVVHATEDISKTIGNLKSLLKNNGMLCLLETTRFPIWLSMIIGLAKGWWAFNDKWRNNHSPLISQNEWEALLTESGFKEIYSINLPSPISNESDTSLILAESVHLTVSAQSYLNSKFKRPSK